jgi:hypothetical protein
MSLRGERTDDGIGGVHSTNLPHTTSRGLDGKRWDTDGTNLAMREKK